MEEANGYALISLTDTHTLVSDAVEILANNFNIVCSRESAKILTDHNIPHTSLEQFTETSQKYGFPVSLDQKIEHLIANTPTGAGIDLVYVNPYDGPGQYDVGGHTLLALAFKGNKIACSTSDHLKSALNCLASGQSFEDVCLSSHINAAPALINNTFKLVFDKCSFPILGENHYQSARLLPSHISHSLPYHNKPVYEYTNIADADRLKKILKLLHSNYGILDLPVPFITIIAKHGNPIGIGISRKDPQHSFHKALIADPLASFGGEVACNYPVHEEMTHHFLSSSLREQFAGDARLNFDVIIAPSISNSSLEILSKRKHRILCELDPSQPLLQPCELRLIEDGYLKQSHYCYHLQTNDVPNHLQARIDDFLIAFHASYGSFHGGNEIALAKDGQLLACAGGPSTIEAAKTAIYRASRYHTISNSIFAADAFFPFIDAPEALIHQEVIAGLVPNGGINQKDIKRVFEKNDVSVIWLDEKLRGFCRH